MTTLFQRVLGAASGANLAQPSVEESTDEVAGRFLAWLAGADSRWLLILGDLPDPLH